MSKLIMHKISGAPEEFEMAKEFCIAHYKLEQEILKSTGKESFVDFGVSEEDWPETMQEIKDNPILLNHPVCGFFCFVEEDNPSKALGMISCLPKLHNGLLEYSIGFLPEAQGKGYGTQALQLFLAHLDPYLNTEIEVLIDDSFAHNEILHGLEAEIDILNVPSLLMHLKHGMKISDYTQLVDHTNVSDVIHYVSCTYPPTIEAATQRVQHHYPIEIWNEDKLNDISSLALLSDKLTACEYSNAEFVTEWQELLGPTLQYHIDGGYGPSLPAHISLQAQFNDLCFSVTPCSDELIVFGGCTPPEIADGEL